MKKKLSLFLALVLCLALLLPTLVSCSKDESAVVTGDEAMATVEENTPNKEEEESEEEAPKGDYIPPSNYIDYTDNEWLAATPNAGTGGVRVNGSIDTVTSVSSVRDELAKNPANFGTAAARRALAEQTMRDMLSVRWTPKEDITYSYNEGAYTSATAVNQDAFNANAITLEAGKVYQGLPYTNGSNGLAAFLYGATAQSGVYTVTWKEKILSGSSAVSARLGINDSDALAWAWSSATASTSFKTSAEMTEKNGVLKVGVYTLTDAQKYTSLAGVTDNVVTTNGKEVMFDAYALVQKADGLVANTELKDHVMMVSSVTVVRDGDGKIDPTKSFVTVLEQTDANLVDYAALTPEEKSAKKNEVLAIGNVDETYTFQELFDQGYLPVTCEELNRDGGIDTLWHNSSFRFDINYTSKSLFTGTIAANRRFALATMVVTDAAGNVVMNTTAFPNESGMDDNTHAKMNMATWGSENADRRIGDVSTSVLKKGEEYKCVVSALLSTGETIEARSFTFKF